MDSTKFLKTGHNKPAWLRNGHHYYDHEVKPGSGILPDANFSHLHFYWHNYRRTEVVVCETGGIIKIDFEKEFN